MGEHQGGDFEAATLQLRDQVADQGRLCGGAPADEAQYLCLIHACVLPTIQGRHTPCWKVARVGWQLHEAVRAGKAQEVAGAVGWAGCAAGVRDTYRYELSDIATGAEGRCQCDSFLWA